MDFWNSLITEKSWNILKNLKKEDFRFIIIGGWAVYLWTRQHKSKDIDIIIPSFNELEKINKRYYLNKNDNLKKYEIKIDNIDIDIYLPYFSKFTLPFETILKDTTKIDSFEVVQPEILLILKQGAEEDRRESIKGEKDRIDIMSILCYTGIDFGKYRGLLKKNKLDRYSKRLKIIISEFKNLKHLNLNAKDYSKIKKELLNKL